MCLRVIKLWYKLTDMVHIKIRMSSPCGRRGHFDEDETGQGIFQVDAQVVFSSSCGFFFYEDLLNYVFSLQGLPIPSSCL